jgi:hypothetical protein
MEQVIPEPHARARFERLGAGFQRAAERVGDSLEEKSARFGGRATRLRFAGRALAESLWRPFAHLRDDAAIALESARLDIALWDEIATGVRADERPWPDAAEVDSVTEVSTSGRFVLQRLPSTSIGLDRASGVLIGSVAWEERVQVYERGKPLARLLAEWYADQGLGLMHAGLVARDGRGVILAGRGGSGKSTAALAAARAGLEFLGEDYVGLELAGEAVTGHSVYGSVFLDRAAADRFPELAPHRVDSRSAREPKSVVLLAGAGAGWLSRSASVRAVALCRVADEASGRVRPASRAEALMALGPSSLLQIHGRRGDSLERLAQLVQRVPCFRLELGRDLGSVAPRIDEILERAGAA